MRKEIILGGGCFWGMEELFRKQPGVVDTEVGYAGGENIDATYQNHPGHAEVLKITYDADVTNLENIFRYFFKIHDPTTKDRQGNDIGMSYRSAIFYETEKKKQTEKKMITEVEASEKWSAPVPPPLEPLKNYSSAEAE